MTFVDVVFLIEGIVVDTLLQHRLSLSRAWCYSVWGDVIVRALVDMLVVCCCVVASFV